VVLSVSESRTEQETSPVSARLALGSSVAELLGHEAEVSCHHFEGLVRSAREGERRTWKRGVA
jgi:hypothetical protein